MKLKDYIAYQRNIDNEAWMSKFKYKKFTEYNNNVLFAVNIDIQEWTSELNALNRSIFPEFLYKTEHDWQSYLR